MNRNNCIFNKRNNGNSDSSTCDIKISNDSSELLVEITEAIVAITVITVVVIIVVDK